MNPNLPEWLQYIQALGPLATIIAAGVAAWVTWKIQKRNNAVQQAQAQTARNKLKLDLFDRRYDVYEAAKKLIFPGDYKFEELRELVLRAYKGEFLFDEQVFAWIDQAVRSASNYRITQTNLQSSHSFSDEQRSTLNTESDAQIVLFKKLEGEIQEIFRPYLSFEKVK